MQRVLLGIGEYLTPVLKDSKFRDTGVLTPEEFVAAGDFLVYKCPTWSWESGVDSKKKNYLPSDKQYLVTRNVPCVKRVKQMEYNEEESEVDGWITTHRKSMNEVSLDEIDIPEIETLQISAAEVDEDIPDIDAFDVENNLVENDPASASNPDRNDIGDNIVKTRTYDLSITYDKYYQTPRIWLFGYDENGHPLKPSLLFEDISQDHAKKTVTIETHPHLNLSLASIHPCRHASVMKKIMDHYVENNRELRVDQYIVLFLKFLSSVLPTIEYDYTMAMDS